MNPRDFAVALSAVVCLMPGTIFAQTYNPTASDPSTGNTAGGTGSLPNPLLGKNNTGFGLNALKSVIGSATGNTAVGTGSQQGTAGGLRNTSVGMGSLKKNGQGKDNAVVGYDAAPNTTTAISNTVIGNVALHAATTGSGNTALGYATLSSVIAGTGNTAAGIMACYGLQSGHENICIGKSAGQYLVTGSDNIYIANFGDTAESNTTRIGDTQTKTFIAGISGVPVTGATVTVNAQGQLGILASSARYKQDIKDIRDRSADIYKLRPVSYSYKTDEHKQAHYGLIAEEVNYVYPEMVLRNAAGEVETIQYQELIPMLISELQKQHQHILDLTHRLENIDRVTPAMTEVDDPLLINVLQ